MRGRRLIAILIGVMGIVLFAIVGIVLLLQSNGSNDPGPVIGADGVSTVDPNVTRNAYS